MHAGQRACELEEKPEFAKWNGSVVEADSSRLIGRVDFGQVF